MNLFSIVFAVCCCMTSVFCLKLTANYDDGDNKYYDIGKALRLKCSADAGTPAISWTKDDKDVAEAFKDVLNHFSVKQEGATSTLEVRMSRAEDDGKYSCAADNQRLDFNVIAKAFAKIKPSDHAVVDGERLTLKCWALGTEVKVRWILPNTTSEERVRNENHELPSKVVITDGTLIIDHVKMSDRGSYQCVAQNDEDESSAVTAVAFVRIKDKYAALWPFIFICIEVFVLCSIILIYEKKRNKTEVEDSETDIAPETKNGKK